MKPHKFLIILPLLLFNTAAGVFRVRGSGEMLGPAKLFYGITGLRPAGTLQLTSQSANVSIGTTAAGGKMNLINSYMINADTQISGDNDVDLFLC